ncbi:MAG: HAMP domain-containing protein [Verrucomicrobia bacterium]|nr:HAMP domain-containing protein [Verrucomicrobiota bacterium]
MGTSLRAKIMTGVIALLVLFAAALTITLYFVKDSGEEVRGIAEYHVPIMAKVNALDVYTYELELLAHDMSEQIRVMEPEKIRHHLARAKQLEEIITRLFTESIDLCEKGSNDSRNDIEDRLVMAKLLGSLKNLNQQTMGFVQTAMQTIDLGSKGKPVEARASLLKMEEYSVLDQIFEKTRQAANRLILDSASETAGNIFTIIWTNIAIFTLAGFLGLIVFLVITGRLQTAFHRLTVAFRKTADGELTDPLPITSQDEIGDLTDSFNHMVEQLKSKEKLREAFGQFLDPRIVANVVDPSTGELKEVAERRRVTIFFSDIANFSTIGEQLTAASLVKLLNRYFTVSTQAVRRHHGIVDKFIGDAVMAFWASPFSEGESHARDGCFACLDLLESFVKVRGEIPDLTGLRRNAPRFHVRMALATGDTVIGTVGSDTTKSFTVIGDTVNTASRLEGVNKIYGTSVLLNEECYRLAESHIEAREIDLVTVLGKAEPVRIYELLGRVGSLDGATQRLANLYADSLQLYREQQWEEATKAFQECLRIRPDDGPSLEFLTRIPALKKNAPPENWDGVWQTSTK